MVTLRAAPVLLGLALVVVACSERPQIVGAEPVETRSSRNVVVVGEASAVGPPRLATFHATVSIWSPDIELAVRECDTVARRVRGQLKNVGVRGTDLVDARRSVEAATTSEAYGSTQILMPSAASDAASDAAGGDPQAAPSALATIAELAAAAPPTEPAWGAPGHLAEQTIAVTVRDLATLPRVLERALSAGAARLGSVRHMPNNPEVLVEKVRQRAVQDARARAQVLAQELGQAVGQANSVIEEELLAPGDDPGAPFRASCRVRVDFTLRGF